MLYWKRYLIIVFLMLLILNCSKQTKNTITFAVGGAPAELQFWETLIKEFEQESNIKVTILRQPTDTDQRRQSLVIPLKSKKKDPDVFLMDIVWIGQMAASGWLEPLDKYVTQNMFNINSFFPKVLNQADKYQGSLIALPVYIDAGMLYYRKDLLQQTGISKPPEFWKDLAEYSIQIQKEMRKTNPNFYGFVWQGAQYEGLICNFLEFAGSNNGGINITNGKVILNTPENRLALQFMIDLINKHKISPPSTFTEMKEEEVRLYFQAGNALFERNWPYAWVLHQEDDSRIKNKVGIASLPHFINGKSVSTLGGWHVTISQYSDVKNLSWQLVKFIVSYPVQKKLAMELGWNPANIEVYQDSEVIKKMPHFEKLKMVFDNAVPRPNIPYYTQLSEVLQRYINSALSGKLTAEQALSEAEKEAQKIIERYQ